MPRTAAYIVVLLIGCASARALLSKRIVAGHDANVYITRLAEYDDSLTYRIFAPRWAPHLGAGYGEPTWIFAPPLFEALCESVHLLGAGYIFAENVTLIGLFLFAGTLMFLIGSRLGGVAGSIAAAVAWFFTPYVLTDLFVRHASAEFSATCFLPVTLLALQRIHADALQGSTLLLAIGVAAVGLTHHGVLLIAFPFWVAGTILLGIKRGAAGWAAGIGLAGGLAIATWSWLPALVERSYVHLNLLHAGFFEFERHFVPFLQLFGIAHPGVLNFSIGPLLLLVAMATLFALRSEDRAEVFFAAAVAAFGIFFSTAASALLWRQAPLMQDLAFPWRFLVLPAVSIPVIIASAARRWPVITLIAVSLHAAMFFPLQRATGYLALTNEDRSPLRIAARGIVETSQDEYRPRWAETLQPSSESAFDPLLPGRQLSYSPVDRLYEVVSPANIVARLHIFYFPGWLVEIDDHHAEIQPSQRTGLIEFALPRGRHLVRARFVATPDRAIADIVTIVGLLAVFLFRNGAAIFSSGKTP